MNQLKDIFVSAVALLKPDSKNIGGQLEQLSAALAQSYAHYEILVIDTPLCLTAEAEMTELIKKVQKVRYIRLFRAATPEILTAAGLENAIGDIVVVGNLNILTPHNLTTAVTRCCAGNDVVNGICNYTKPVWYQLGSACFRKFCGSLIHYQLPTNDTGFRAVSRRLITGVTAEDNFYRFPLLLLSNFGGQQCNLEIDISAADYRQDACRNNFSQALSMLIFNSIKPLRIVNFLALGSSFLSILFALYSLAVHLVKDQVVEGWTTLMLVVTILFALLFAVLSFIGEYLARIVQEYSRHRSYQVLFEKHSSVMLDLTELNIKSDSVSTEINRVQTGRDR